MPAGEGLESNAVVAGISSALVLAEASVNARPTPLETALPDPLPESAIAPLPSWVEPFAGLAGYCFLYSCRLVELVIGWLEPSAMPADFAAKSLLQSSARSSLKHWGACSIGTIYCTLAAAAVIPMFHATSIKSFLPFAFLIIIVMVAARFGRAAGVLGTIAAALLFAAFLYEPSPSLAISDPASKDHLIWMLIIGIVISDLVARFQARTMTSNKF